MIFAEFIKNESLELILEVLRNNFLKVDSDKQSDSWIWIHDNEMKVSIDTFTNNRFEVKANEQSYLLLNRVLVVLNLKFSLKIYSTPKFEVHE